MDEIEEYINKEKKDAMYEEECLSDVDLLFDKTDLLESGESLEDLYK